MSYNEETKVVSTVEDHLDNDVPAIMSNNGKSEMILADISANIANKAIDAAETELNGTNDSITDGILHLKLNDANEVPQLSTIENQLHLNISELSPSSDHDSALNSGSCSNSSSAAEVNDGASSELQSPVQLDDISVEAVASNVDLHQQSATDVPSESTQNTSESLTESEQLENAETSITDAINSEDSSENMTDSEVNVDDGISYDVDYQVDVNRTEEEQEESADDKDKPSTNNVVSEIDFNASNIGVNVVTDIELSNKAQEIQLFVEEPCVQSAIALPNQSSLLSNETENIIEINQQDLAEVTIVNENITNHSESVEIFDELTEAPAVLVETNTGTSVNNDGVVTIQIHDVVENSASTIETTIHSACQAEANTPLTVQRVGEERVGSQLANQFTVPSNETSEGEATTKNSVIELHSPETEFNTEAVVKSAHSQLVCSFITEQTEQHISEPDVHETTTQQCCVKKSLSTNEENNSSARLVDAVPPVVEGLSKCSETATSAQESIGSFNRVEDEPIAFTTAEPEVKLTESSSKLEASIIAPASETDADETPLNSTVSSHGQRKKRLDSARKACTIL